MDTCAVETGLLRKKPCGQAAVAKCANCEIALCNQHAVAQLSPTKQRTGKFMCAECVGAQREADKGVAAANARHAPPPAAKKPAEASKPAADKAPPAKPHDSADDPLEFKPTKK